MIKNYFIHNKLKNKLKRKEGKEGKINLYSKFLVGLDESKHVLLIHTYDDLPNYVYRVNRFKKHQFVL